MVHARLSAIVHCKFKNECLYIVTVPLSVSPLSVAPRYTPFRAAAPQVTYFVCTGPIMPVFAQQTR